MMYRNPPCQKVVPVYPSIGKLSVSLDSPQHLLLLKYVFANFVGKIVAFNDFFSYILVTKRSVLKIF